MLKWVAKYTLASIDIHGRSTQESVCVGNTVIDIHNCRAMNGERDQL